MLKFKYLTLACAFALVSQFATTASAQCIPGSDKSFSRVKPGNVGAKLNELELFNCLNFLQEQSDDACTKLALLFNNVFVADPEDVSSIDENMAKIAELFPKAIEELDALHTKYSGKNLKLSESAKLSSFELRVLYAYLLTAQPIDEAKSRMIFTIASPEQIERVSRNAEKAMKMLKACKKLVKSYIRELEEDQEDNPARYMFYLQPLSTIKRIIYYREISATTYYCLGKYNELGKLSSTNTKLLRKRLKRCVKYIKSGRFGKAEVADLNEWKAYMSAMLGDYKAASEAMGEVLKAKPTDERAVFCKGKYQADLAAKLLKEGKTGEANNAFAQAEATVKALAKMKNGKAGDESNEFSIDWKIVMLDFYIYNEWSKVLKEKGDNAQAEKKSDRAIQDFVDLMMKYRKNGQTGRIYLLWTVLEPKLAGKEFKTSNPVMQMFQATMKYSAGKEKAASAGSNAIPEIDQAIEEFLKIIEASKNNKDADKKELFEIALPGSYWYLGVINATYNHKIDNTKAIYYLRKLAAEYPKDPNAYRANRAAIDISRSMIRNANLEKKRLSIKFYKDLDASIGVMIDSFKNEHPDVVNMNFQRAENAMDISNQSTKPEEINTWRDNAIKYYNAYANKTGSLDTRNAAIAKFRAIKLSYEKFKEGDKKYRTKVASNLTNEIYRFTLDMDSNIKDYAGKFNAKEKEYFRDMAALVDYYGAVIKADKGEDVQAKAQLEKLIRTWKGAPATSKAQAYLIQLNLERGEVEEALKQFDAYEKNSSKEESTALMFEIVTALQDKLHSSSADMPKQKRIKLKKAFIGFAKKVYDTNYEQYNKPNLSSSEMNAKIKLSLLYAESLLLVRKKASAEKAMEVLSPVEAYEKERKKGYIKENEAKFKKLAKQITDLLTDVKNEDKIKKARKAVMIYQSCKAGLSSSVFYDLKIVAADRACNLVNKIYNYKRLKRIADANGKEVEKHKIPTQGISEVIPTLRASILAALPKLEKAHNGIVDSNAELALLQGRANYILRKYKKAAKIYRNIFDGMVPDANNEYQYKLYWNSLVGYLKAQIGYAKKTANPQILDNMDFFIDQQRKMYKSLGGPKTAAIINKLQAKIQKLANIKKD